MFCRARVGWPELAGNRFRVVMAVATTRSDSGLNLIKVRVELVLEQSAIVDVSQLRIVIAVKPAVWLVV